MLVCTVADGWDIFNLKVAGSYFIFTRINGASTKLGRIHAADASGSTDWTAETSYDDNYQAGGTLDSMQKTIYQGNELLCGQEDFIYHVDNDSTITNVQQQDL